jgi:hypothetical protein
VRTGFSHAVDAGGSNIADFLALAGVPDGHG